MTTQLTNAAQLQQCPLCSAPLPDPDRCSKCDWVREPLDDRRSERQARDLTALGLSVIPGAGHIFKGYKALGWTILLLGVPVILVLAFAFTMFFGWLMVPAYWIAVGADAFFRRDLRRPATAPLR